MTKEKRKIGDFFKHCWDAIIFLLVGVLADVCIFLGDLILGPCDEDDDDVETDE